MTLNPVDVIIQRYGGGWIWDAYAHGTIDPVGQTHYLNLPTYRTPEDALAAAHRRLGHRIVTERIIER